MTQVPTAAGFQPGSSGRVMWESNCDFPRNDCRSVNALPEMCGDLCADDAACTHWTWNNYSGGTCWLKQDTPSPKTRSYGAICGYVVSRSSTAAASSGLSTSDMADMLGRINSLRAQNGLGALAIDYRLVKAALLHSQDQASHCQMTHKGTTIRDFGDRLEAQGYSYNTAAENVAAGQTTVADVMTSWWNSPGHRANILNKDVVNVGLALATNEACGDYATYWTQDFGRQL
ncbi:hypothetical protein PHYSODRAFT_329592 [Phytophthora sojae]|uniref:SCP domain-containing protein n=1 Tax=Phytophthora sojae (strain P6497) TaxID=1094619 RepID=G4Z5J9_PHYSP|nr:hypothetical protein PHYSODRAFT_329592 [Phytophthora sojae]EGZ21677.1 hypothetical protein PHYSODRAFT_329592 [Phytophthora sojae]|eukprot:XP_009524394.1 hypothetical protein PHYSODRAFT_329592 [Phytophthora sojae]